jgi:cell shape-determining protein MreC
VGVRLVRSGDVGASRGQGPDRPLEVDLISLETPVLPGESVVTSGIQGSQYPEGLLVGTVVDVDALPIADSQVVMVRPAAAADGLRFATVLLFEPEPIPVPTTTAVPSTTPATAPTEQTSTTATDPTSPDTSVADPPTGLVGDSPLVEDDLLGGTPGQESGP